MILLVIIVIAFAGGLLAWLTSAFSTKLPRIIALLAVAADLIISLILFFRSDNSTGAWMQEFSHEWIPRFGISLHFAMDGLSLLMIILTFFLGLVAIILSWKAVNQRTGFFYFNLMSVIAGITGVFLAMDLFLFYFFWEVMLVPLFLLIGIWGNVNKTYASYKFFIFTQASGLLMLISIVTLYLIHGAKTGIYTFEYLQLLGTEMSLPAAMLVMMGFVFAFFVKMPAVPFHSWLPDAYTESPAAVIPAGLLLKIGAYGLLRFVIPMFPDASLFFAPVGMLFGIAGILYGAKLAYAQTDFRRLIAYMSISHAGLIIFGIFAFNELAYQGVIMQMVIHAVSTGALFIVACLLYARLNTFDITKTGGLWKQAPVLGAMGMVFILASLGLPGTGNFVAEFLTLLGAFKMNFILSIVASLGLIVAAVYSLRIMQKIFFGKTDDSVNISDLNLKEKLLTAIMVIVIFFFGFYPKPLINKAKPAVQKTLEYFNDPAGLNKNSYHGGYNFKLYNYRNKK